MSKPRLARLFRYGTSVMVGPETTQDHLLHFVCEGASNSLGGITTGAYERLYGPIPDTHQFCGPVRAQDEDAR